MDEKNNQDFDNRNIEINESEESPTSKPPKKVISKGAIFGIIGGAVAVVAVVLIIILGGNGHKHEFDEWKIATAPTCTKNGSESRSCECGEIETRDINATGHSFGEWENTKNPTCTENGVAERYCSCGEKGEKTIAALGGHTYGEWNVTTDAKCESSGSKKHSCTLCGNEESQVIPATGHSYGSWIVDQNATCKTSGKKHAVCSVCLHEKAESIPISNNHTYNAGTITNQPTCTSTGSKTLTCTVCQKTKVESINALGHSTNSSGTCTRCGLTVLNMTQSEIEKSKKIAKMTHSVTEYSSYISLSITLKDDDGYTIQVPVYVKIKIVDDNGTVLYDKTVIKKSSQSNIKIDHSELKPGTTEIGTFYYKVYNDYVNFDEISKEMTDLPWTVSVQLPTLPDVIWDNGWNSSACTITEITYEVSGDDLYIYFTGEKSYDEKGSGYSQSCKIGWKLYDSDGYVVDNGTCYTSSLKVGEKFKNARSIAFDVIEKGKTYKLVILDLS